MEETSAGHNLTSKIEPSLPREILIYRVLIPFKHPFKTVFKSGIV